MGKGDPTDTNIKMSRLSENSINKSMTEVLHWAHALKMNENI